MHVYTDIISWDKPLTSAECMDKGKAAIGAADPKLTTLTADHATVGTKNNWVVSVDCLQSYKVNAAYVTFVYTGTDVNLFKRVQEAVKKSLGGKSDDHKS